MTTPTGRIIAVNRGAGHAFSKAGQLSVRLVEGHGIEGDVHAGPTMKGEGRRIVPDARQVHLMHRELFDDLAGKGFAVAPGVIGENLTTEGIDLLSLPLGTRLHIGQTAIVELTGLRAPCVQVERFAKGLLYELAHKQDGKVRIKSGVMSIVVRSGEVLPGDAITAVAPPAPHRPLEPV